jgi:hypothetical protein
MDNLPAATLGTSYQLYTDLGLRQIGIFPDVAIIELRGGNAHLAGS